MLEGAHPGIQSFMPAILPPTNYACRKHDVVCDWLANLQNKVPLIQSVVTDQELLLSSHENHLCSESSFVTISGYMKLDSNGHVGLRLLQARAELPRWIMHAAQMLHHVASQQRRRCRRVDMIS